MMLDLGTLLRKTLIDTLALDLAFFSPWALQVHTLIFLSGTMKVMEFIVFVECMGHHSLWVFIIYGD